MTKGIAEFQAAVLIVVVTLSLAYAIYSQVDPFVRAQQRPSPVFLNRVTPVGGSPEIFVVHVNASSDSLLEGVTLDGFSSTSGVLAFNGTGYLASGSLCARGETTFFSVYASSAGRLVVSTDGSSWIAGAWTTAAGVPGGSYSEVMIRDASSCSVTEPDGQTLTAAGRYLSGIPVTGVLNGTAFTLSVPGDQDGVAHQMLMVFQGGVDALDL